MDLKWMPCFEKVYENPKFIIVTENNKDIISKPGIKINAEFCHLEESISLTPI